MRSIRPLARYLFRFITDTAYRNMVIGGLNEHLSRSEGRTIQRASGVRRFAWASGETAYLVGGCELMYLKDELESFGMRCSHSFELATAQDPFSELRILGRRSIHDRLTTSFLASTNHGDRVKPCRQSSRSSRRRPKRSSGRWVSASSLA